MAPAPASLGPGGGATLLAALVPSLEAARIRVRAVWYREDLEERLEGKAGAFALGGLGSWPWRACFATLRFGSGPPFPGFAAAFLILLGFSFFTPLAARSAGRGLAAGFRRCSARPGTWAAATWPAPCPGAPSPSPPWPAPWGCSLPWR
jgi:hypothetical protein